MRRLLQISNSQDTKIISPQFLPQIPASKNPFKLIKIVMWIIYQINYTQQQKLRYFMQEAQIRSESNIYIQEESQMQCKICFLKNAPLLRLCDCKGSIGFVHEDCILKWLTVKLQQMTLLEMPCCEVCKSPYAAQLKSRSDKLSIKQVVKKLRSMSYITILTLIISIIGIIAVPYVEVVGIQRLWKHKIDNYVVWVFSFVIFPFYFMKSAFGFLKQYQYKLKECLVRQVQIYLLPKQIYR